ncbi:hypothetical protein KRX19_05475 [Cardiobacteriaceae bacterium TAE3-ERU3]|nr:hypothetical protein [Cardiobacteriaceae bacterium TAE3-ERU3]
MEQKQVNSSFLIDKDLKVFLKIHSAKNGKSMSYYINKMLREFAEAEKEADNGKAIA